MAVCGKVQTFTTVESAVQAQLVCRVQNARMILSYVTSNTSLEIILAVKFSEIGFNLIQSMSQHV